MGVASLFKTRPVAAGAGFREDIKIIFARFRDAFA